MSELKVRVTGDSAGFNATLDQAKTQAAKFNQSLVADSKRLAAENKRIGSTGQIGVRGAALANAAGSLAGAPGGVGDAAGKIAIGAGAIFGLKETATQLGLSMAKAGGMLALFAAAIFAVTKMYDELGKWVKAVKDETESGLRSRRKEKQTAELYDKAITDNLKLFGPDKAKALRVGIHSADVGERNAAMKEVRRIAGGFGAFNDSLKKDLAKAQIEAMQEGPAKDIAKEKFRFSEESAQLRERIGKTPSVATRGIANQLMGAMWQEHQNKLAEIQQKQLMELKKIGENTKQYKDPFK